jgi:hypothetical protein
MRLTGIAIYFSLFSVAACAQGISATCERAFETGFSPDGDIKMHLRSGDIYITGSDAGKIRVTCELKKEPDRAKDVKVAFKPTGNSGELRISGGPTNDVRIHIEVPRKSHIWVRCPAGDLKVKDIVGNKDVELHAGDLVINVGAPSDYAHADASVKAGDLSATAFGVTKGGLFRSFEKDNPGGKYRLHAHLGAGDLVLK